MFSEETEVRKRKTARHVVQVRRTTRMSLPATHARLRRDALRGETHGVISRKEEEEVELIPPRSRRRWKRGKEELLRAVSRETVVCLVRERRGTGPCNARTYARGTMRVSKIALARGTDDRAGGGNVFLRPKYSRRFSRLSPRPSN